MRFWLLLVALVCAGLASCSTNGLQFRADDRIEVVAPQDRASVTLPLDVRWTADGLPEGASFAVAVDTAPPRPGSAPSKFADITRTADTQVTLDHVGSAARGRHGLHRITVFLLDAAGKRLGESAWRVDVHVKDAA